MNRMNIYNSETYCVRYNSYEYTICMYTWDTPPFDTEKIIFKRNADGYYDYKIVIDILDTVMVSRVICDSKNHLNDITFNEVKSTTFNGETTVYNLNSLIKKAKILMVRDRNSLPMFSNILYPFYYNSVIYVSIDEEGIYIKDYSEAIKELISLMTNDNGINSINKYIDAHPDEMLWEEICPIEDIISYYDNLFA